jgi:ADP-ribosylglycohydrolase
VGRATIRASLRIALGLKPSGVWSAGNGAAMRAGVVGVFFQDRPEPRRAFGRALAETTHRDPRAIEGALYVAEIAACCAVEPAEASRRDIAVRSQAVVADRELATAIDRAISLADAADSTQDAAKVCGTSGYVVSTVAFATFCFLKYGDDPIEALSQAIAAGGDTDSIAAILGGWLGALHGERGLPPSLLGRIHDGPFGPTHLRALARCLEARLTGTLEAVPRYSAAAALVRNLLLYPVVIAHGFRRLLPF